MANTATGIVKSWITGDSFLAADQESLNKGTINDIIVDNNRHHVLLSGTGENSIMQDNHSNIASGLDSVALGSNTSATGSTSMAIGSYTQANALYAFSSGNKTEANGSASAAFGNYTYANGTNSFTNGAFNTADGNYSHAGGVHSKSGGNNSFIHSNYSEIKEDAHDSGIFVGSYNYVEADVLRSAVIGGTGISATTNDTVYVPGLNIGTVGAGASVKTLGLDASGNVVEAAGSIIIPVTGSTYTLNETINYNEIICHITADSTITIDTDQLSKDANITFKVVGNYSVTAGTEGAETIDGETTQLLGEYDAMSIYTYASNWWIK